MRLCPKMLFVLSGGAALVLDQFSKGLLPYAQIAQINPHFAWSLPSPWPFFTVGVAVVGLLLLFLLMRAQRVWEAPERRWLLVGYGLILGAGLSNLLDRLWWGGVRDIWTVSVLPGLKLQNNLADWLLLVGVVGVVFGTWLQRENDASEV